MKIGKVPEKILERSVFKQIKSRRGEVLLGPGIGEDCAVLKLNEDEAFVVTTDPITGALYDIGTLAVHITANDIASGGAEPIGVLLTILLPPYIDENALKVIMKEVEETCESLEMEVLGGHTEVTEAVNQPIISVAGVGKVKENKIIRTSGAIAGQDIVMTKWAGLEGTAILAKEHEKELREKYNDEFIHTAKDMIQYISIVKESKIGMNYDVTSLHDVTEGGIFGALWEMAESSKVGVDINIRDIPIKQHTIEVCEFFNINPYMLISSGCLLMTTDKGHKLVKALAEEGIEAAVIGSTTEGLKKIIRVEDEVKYLAPPGSDELYKVDKPSKQKTEVEV